MKILDVQNALAALGLKPGPLDGIWGRQTVAALRDYQSRNGLVPDGVLGPMTFASLFPQVAVPAGFGQPGLVWFKEATRLQGTKEKPGSGSNSTILDWAGAMGISYAGDDIAWCGLFVGHCITATLDREPTPATLLRARSWKSFGIATKPTLGAVMVFWRKSLASGLGHVGFYAGEDDGAYRILGGNQTDSVSLAWIAKDRLISARWPATVAPPVPQAVRVARTDTLSWNEG